MNFLDFLGFFAGVCFSISSIPLVIKTIKNKTASYIPLTTILSILIGSISMISYLIIKNGLDSIVILDYFLTISSQTILLIYKMKDYLNVNSNRT